METPTITRVSLEPFCSHCGGGLRMQGDSRPRHDLVAGMTLGLVVGCPNCNRLLWTSEVAWREREKKEPTPESTREREPLLEPCCSLCVTWLEPQSQFLGFALRCLGCGKLLESSEVAWRERKEEE